MNTPSNLKSPPQGLRLQSENFRPFRKRPPLTVMFYEAIITAVSLLLFWGSPTDIPGLIPSQVLDSVNRMPLARATADMGQESFKAPLANPFWGHRDSFGCVILVVGAPEQDSSIDAVLVCLAHSVPRTSPGGLTVSLTATAFRPPVGQLVAPYWARGPTRALAEPQNLSAGTATYTNNSPLIKLSIC